ncbi:Uncharacterised protein [Mycobacteroides abscessus subsp. abscessus]|nr:Uncharacterised protein [Mycobacteroides abscessus subsp. abscessus]SIF90284.1 Uncharacterised protein [Mycobacteroides abscessus subsp. abscessus]
MQLPARITIREVLLRDGAHLAAPIPLADKPTLLDARARGHLIRLNLQDAGAGLHRRIVGKSRASLRDGKTQQR